MDFHLAEVVWVTLTFLLGAAVGSFINVVVGRLPLEKSLLWPNSRCLTCLTSLTFADNLPIVGWLRRGGRCRYCGTPFSSRYLWVELAAGVGFAVLFYLDVIANWHRMPGLETVRYELTATGLPAWQAVVVFLHHAVLFSFLLAAALCDWDHRAIPLSLTVFGTLIGLAQATAWPWPWPNDPAVVARLSEPVVTVVGVRDRNWAFDVKPGELPLGLYPWPVWGPVPDWLASHRWALGLVTGLAGAAVGMAMIRAVKYTFEKGLGKEALGLGDADLMMMAGAFLGWQPVVVAFFVGAIVSLPLGIAFRLVKGERAFPFGPGLAAGILITMLFWRHIGPVMQMYLFEEILVLVAAFVLTAGLFLGSIMVRVLGFGR
jgi:leader peptidase (prepilin peptidase)/N-methyltransferase